MKAIRNLASLVCAFSICINISAQECNTPSPAPPAWLFNPALRSAQTTPSGTYTLGVYIHIVRSSGGSGLGAEIVTAIISRLNSDYSGTRIQFQIAGNDFIDNSTYYDHLSESEYVSLFSTNSHSDAIDIYVLGTSSNGPAGTAADIPSTAFIVHGVFCTPFFGQKVGLC
jgi:hypothetical protein